MAHRIHPGMTEAQVNRLLGQPYQVQSPSGTFMNDVIPAPRFQNMYCGWDVPLYVGFRDAYREKDGTQYFVVFKVSAQQIDMGDNFWGVFHPLPPEAPKETGQPPKKTM